MIESHFSSFDLLILRSTDCSTLEGVEHALASPRPRRTGASLQSPLLQTSQERVSVEGEAANLPSQQNFSLGVPLEFV